MKDLGREFEENSEIQAFTNTFAPLLAEAMHMRSLSIADSQFYAQAQDVKRKILGLVAWWKD